MITTSSVDGWPLRGRKVRVTTGSYTVAGHLTISQHPRGVVVFAHGTGSFQPRSRYVAEVLNRAGLATLSIDLLTPDVQHGGGLLSEIALLARRLAGVTAWLSGQPDTASLPIGSCGAGTWATAALRAAADAPAKVAAVVCLSGRTDLVETHLARLQAATLLIVGGRDETVLELNRRAQSVMRTEVEIAVVPGANNRFEEPGTLDKLRRWPASGLSRTSVESLQSRRTHKKSPSNDVSRSLPANHVVVRAAQSSANRANSFKQVRLAPSSREYAAP